MQIVGSEQILQLARGGMPSAAIAKQLSISQRKVTEALKRAQKPSLTVDRLNAAGFRHSGSWSFTDGMLAASGDMPKESGVYAFVHEGRAIYVGIAARGLAKRFAVYARPGTVESAARIRMELIDRLFAGKAVDIYTICSPALSWNGLPVNLSAGLEAGLLQAFDIPLNTRGAR
jgi:hypothetical protein